MSTPTRETLAARLRPIERLPWQGVWIRTLNGSTGACYWRCAWCDVEWSNGPHPENDCAFVTVPKLARQAADALDALAWQPIDTAPKDDSSILAVTSTGVHLIVWWGYLRDADGSPDRAWECASGWPANLVGWMPLPAPPTGPRDAT